MEVDQMKRLYSIGDSFMTTDDPDDGIVSFCELYCREKNFKHISLARPGATVFATRLQIERACDEQADCAIIGITCSDRFDIVISDLINYLPLLTLDNIYYTGFGAKSEKFVRQDQVSLVSDTFVNMFKNGRKEVKDDYKKLIKQTQLDALRHYITDLHHPRLSVQKDYYIISDGLRKLTSAGIDFVLIPGWMKGQDWSWVKRTWPKNVPQPYDTPYGWANWETPIRYTSTHNPEWAHKEFCKTLLDITPDWQ